MVSVREAVIPGDYEVMAEVISAEQGDWPVSAEELAARDAARDSKFFHLALLAEIDGQVVGVGTVGHIPFIHQEGRFGIDLRVRPERQGEGAGKALYAALMERLALLRPRELFTEVWDTLPRPVRFLRERGFRATWRRLDSTLKVGGFDFTPYAGLEDHLAAQGINITSFVELASDPLSAACLHELDYALLIDMPYGEPQTKISLEQFVGETLKAPAFLPEACFIARRGDEWIGYSNLLRGGGYFVTQMTGVTRSWRRKGVATLLKLKGIRYALEHGALEIRTTNDEVNAEMLAINRRLGFHETGVMVRYQKTIEGVNP